MTDLVTDHNADRAVVHGVVPDLREGRANRMTQSFKTAAKIVARHCRSSAPSTCGINKVQHGLKWYAPCVIACFIEGRHRMALPGARRSKRLEFNGKSIRDGI